MQNVITCKFFRTFCELYVDFIDIKQEIYTLVFHIENAKTKKNYYSKDSTQRVLAEHTFPS